jgi:hypothetical protein
MATEQADALQARQDRMAQAEIEAAVMSKSSNNHDSPSC